TATPTAADRRRSPTARSPAARDVPARAATARRATRAPARVAAAAAQVAAANSAAPARTRTAPRGRTGIRATRRCSRPTTPIPAPALTGVPMAHVRAATARTTARADRVPAVPAPAATAARAAIAAATAERCHAGEAGPPRAVPRRLPGDPAAGAGPGDGLHRGQVRSRRR